MRNVLVSLIAAASVVGSAAPASAQWYPQPRAYAYGPSNYGLARAMKARIDHIQRQISFLAQRRMISRHEYSNLIGHSRDLERRLMHNARDGRRLTRQEAYDTERRLAWLEYKVAQDVRDGRHWAYRW
jgi:hypothetical protein